MYSPEQQQHVISLARRSIEFFFKQRKLAVIEESGAPEFLRELRSCFVTLTIDGELRGCIGHIEPTQPLYKDIIENAVAAAFEDSRFLPLTEDEYKNVKVEVSVMGLPQPLDFEFSRDLLSKIRPSEDGVIIQRGIRGATYLPQVWEDFTSKEQFLSSLCLKAGLPADDWTRPGLKVLIYQVEAINETKLQAPAQTV